MGYFTVRYDSRVVIYEHKMLIRLATGQCITYLYSKYGCRRIQSRVKFHLRNSLSDVTFFLVVMRG